jgi:lysozyme family protein
MVPTVGGMSDLPDVVDALIKRVEGGFQDDPRDPGNWTGGQVGAGQLVGTKYGISAAANPDLDIPNLTWEEAEDIYFLRYWIPSRAQVAWTEGQRALALVTMDGALHSGVSRGRAWIEKADGSYPRAVALRLDYLTRLEIWTSYHRGWTRRIADLLTTAASLDSTDVAGRVDLLVDNRAWLARVAAAFAGRSGPIAYRVRRTTEGDEWKMDVRSA